jgi:amino acid permease
MLIVKASAATNRTRYEDIALALFGQRISMLVSFLNLICLIGFTMSYITFIKVALADIVDRYSTNEQIKLVMGNGTGKDGWGQIFWACLFAFAILFPMSIPRSASVLRFSSLFGVLCSIYLGLAVFSVFFDFGKYDM